jgi:WD40 repeat protein
MRRIIFASLALAAASLMSWPTLFESDKPSRTIVLEHAELKFAPAALAFDQKGELYVAYRDQGSNKKSSAIWVRVFDAASGKELRSTQLQTATVPLPNSANQFLLSPDNSLLLYSQFSGGTLITVLNAATLQKMSDATSLPEGADRQFPRLIGIGPNDNTVLIAAEITNRLNGTDARLIKLDAHNLSHVLSDVTFINPIPESGFAVGSDGTVRIIRADMLYSYDTATKKAVLELSIHNQDDIRNALVLNDHSLLLWSGQNEFGYLYRFKQSGSTPEESQRIEKSSVAKVLVSPDQLYGVALREHQKLTEGSFGAITSRTAVIFDARTLKIISEVSIERDLKPELAIWHGNGKIVLATQASSDKLEIYELAEPKSASESATMDPKTGNLHLTIPLVAGTKRRSGD